MIEPIFQTMMSDHRKPHEGSRRKTHIAILGSGEALCGIRRVPLSPGAPIDNIRQFVNSDADEELCSACLRRVPLPLEDGFVGSELAAAVSAQKKAATAVTVLLDRDLRLLATKHQITIGRGENTWSYNRRPLGPWFTEKSMPWAPHDWKVDEDHPVWRELDALFKTVADLGITPPILATYAPISNVPATH